MPCGGQSYGKKSCEKVNLVGEDEMAPDEV